MGKSTLADAVVATHFLWIAYVVLGQAAIAIGIPLGWKWIRGFWFRFTHLTMMMLVAVETLFGIDCPLTVWEKRLRGLTGGIYYTQDDSFIARWLGNLIYYDLDGGSWPFVVGYLGFAALVAGSFWLAPPRLPMSLPSFVGLVHATIGIVLLASAWQHWGVGACFLVQGILWHVLQNRGEAKPERGARF